MKKNFQKLAAHWLKTTASNSTNRYIIIYDIFRILSLHDPEIWFAHQGGEPSADSAAWRVDVILKRVPYYII